MSWNIPALCEKTKFEYERAYVFDKEMYPGYENRKVNQKGSFPVFDAKTYGFKNFEISQKLGKSEI